MAARMESRARAGPSGGASGGQKKPRKSGGGMFACCSAPVAVASLDEGSVLESACHIQFNGKVTSSGEFSLDRHPARRQVPKAARRPRFSSGVCKVLLTYSTALPP